MAEMTEKERAEIRAAGVPEEAMEDGELLPTMQRLGGHGPPAEVGRPKRCWHCGVLKSHIKYYPYMWSRQAHQPCVCRWCETHLNSQVLMLREGEAAQALLEDTGPKMGWVPQVQEIHLTGCR